MPYIPSFMGNVYLLKFSCKLFKIFHLKLEIVINARKEALFKNPSTGKFFEVDLWLPKYNLGFEFQVHNSSVFIIFA